MKTTTSDRNPLTQAPREAVARQSWWVDVPRAAWKQTIDAHLPEIQQSPEGRSKLSTPVIGYTFRGKIR